MKTLPQFYSFVSSALFSSENEKSESEERFKRPATDLRVNSHCQVSHPDMHEEMRSAASFK